MGLKGKARKACLLFAYCSRPRLFPRVLNHIERRRRERERMARGDTMVEHDFFQIEKLKAASFRAADGKSAPQSSDPIDLAPLL